MALVLNRFSIKELIKINITLIKNVLYYLDFLMYKAIFEVLIEVDLASKNIPYLFSIAQFFCHLNCFLTNFE